MGMFSTANVILLEVLIQNNRNSPYQTRLESNGGADSSTDRNAQSRIVCLSVQSRKLDPKPVFLSYLRRILGRNNENRTTL
jgi:hypothetical protein